MYKSYIKPLVDFVISAFALFLLNPFLIFIFISLFVKQKKSGVFYTQTRPGENAKPFKIIKFKTMSDERDAAGKLLPDHVRLTPIGRFLRNSSLDEILPKWNCRNH